MEIYLHKELGDGEYISSVDSCDSLDNASNDILTIYPKKRCVLWYAKGGTRLIRQFCFPDISCRASTFSSTFSIKGAVFCNFLPRFYNADVNSILPKPLRVEGAPKKDDQVVIGSSKKCIAIMVSSTQIQIHQYSGESFDVHLPYPMSGMIATKFGLIFQTQKPVLVQSSFVPPQRDGPSDGDMSGDNMRAESTACFRTVSFYSMLDPSAPLVPVQNIDK